MRLKIHNREQEKPEIMAKEPQNPDLDKYIQETKQEVTEAKETPKNTLLDLLTFKYKDQTVTGDFSIKKAKASVKAKITKTDLDYLNILIQNQFIAEKAKNTIKASFKEFCQTPQKYLNNDINTALFNNTRDRIEIYQVDPESAKKEIELNDFRQKAAPLFIKDLWKQGIIFKPIDQTGSAKNDFLKNITVNYTTKERGQKREVIIFSFEGIEKKGNKEDIIFKLTSTLDEQPNPEHTIELTLEALQNRAFSKMNDNLWFSESKLEHEAYKMILNAEKHLKALEPTIAYDVKRAYNIIDKKKK